MAAGHPSPAVGLRLSLRLRKLVGAVWIAGILAGLPLWAVLETAVAETRAHLPPGPLPEGDRELIVLELLQPVAGSIAVTAALAVAAFFAWSVVWHAGTVRWWGGAGAARVRLAEILGHGVVWWWRFARLWLTGIVAAIGASAATWIALGSLMLAVGSGRAAYGLMAAGLFLTSLIVVVCWLATLRGAWFLGESGRRSALVAWARGLGASLVSPLRSLAPVVSWAVPALALLAMPLLIEPPFAFAALLLAWLGAAWCWVALFLSYAPLEPPDDWVRRMQARAAARAARPREQQPGYSTQRFPTQQ